MSGFSASVESLQGTTAGAIRLKQNSVSSGHPWPWILKSCSCRGIRRRISSFGQVVIPGHIVYVRGRDPKYYIEKAGGYTSRANSGSLKVIKAKTKQWLE